MSMRIFGNVSSLNIINQLKTYQNTMAKSMERITAGQGIVTPADSPVSYAMSERFRTELVDIRARQSNVQSGISLLQTGETNLDRMIDILQDVKGRIEDLRGPSNPTDVKNTEIYADELLSEFGDIAETTHYNELYLFNSAREGQARSSFLTAFGPDMFQNTVASAHGIRDTFDRFNIENMLQDITKTFTAGMGDIGGAFQSINRSFAGGYLEGLTNNITIGDPNAIPGRDVSVKLDVDNIRDVQQNFSSGYVGDVTENFTVNTTTSVTGETFQAQETARIQNTFDAGGIQEGTANFEYQVGTQTQFEIANPPIEGTTRVTATEQYENGQVLDIARVHTSGSQDILGTRVGDFEVVGVQYHHPNKGSGKIASIDLKYLGEAQNIQVEAYRGKNVEADHKIATYNEVQQGDVFTIQQAGGHGGKHNYLEGMTTIQAVATENTTGPTVELTEEQFSVDGGTLTVNEFGMERAALEVSYQYGTPQADFQLTEAPVGNVEVQVNGQAVDPADYAIDGTTLTFAEGAKPQAGDQVEVNFDAGRATEAITLEQNLETVDAVRINGQETTDFTVSGNQILFNGATQPAYGNQIEVDYQATATQTLFELQDTPVAEMQVAINGQTVDPANYTIDGDTVEFNEGFAPQTGDQVTMAYGVEQDQAEFLLTDEPVTGQFEVRVQGQTVDPAAFTLEGRTLTFNEGNVPAAGMDVQVNYQAGDKLDRVTLEQEPIEGTMEVLVNGQAIQEDAQNGYTIQGDQVVFNGAANPFYGDQVEINFQTPTAPNTFVLDEAPHADGQVNVAINGRQINEAGIGTVFAENFDDIIGDLTGYEVVNGRFTAENGVATAAPDNGGDTMAMTDVRMQNARISLDVTAADRQAGDGYITFGYQNENDYFRAGVGEDGNTFVIERMQNGQAEQYATYNPAEATGETYNLQVELNGENVKVFADGELAIEANIEGLEAGQIGMGARGTGAVLDNFEIATIEGALDGYQINGDEITFFGGAIPQEGDQLTVNFEAARPNTEFDLNIEAGIEPNAGTMQVAINGQAVDAADYTIEGDTLTFTGAAQPTYGDEVTAAWDTGERLDHINLFDEVEPMPNEGTLQIFKNGELLEADGENGYELDAGYLLLNGAAQGELGDVFEARYQIGADVTELELANAPNEGTIEVTINGERIMTDEENPSNGWTIEGNTLQLHGLAVPEIGDEVQINYQTGDEFTQMTLSQTDVNAETVKVFVNGERLAAGAENGFTVEGDVVNFNGEGIPGLGDEVVVDFGVGDLMKEFELLRTPEMGTFTMTINGQEITEGAENGFTIDGRTVRLNGEGVIPGQGDNIEYNFTYTGGADTDSASPIVLPSGMETKIQTPFVADFTLVGVGLDKIDLSSEAGIDYAIEGIEFALDKAMETQVRAGAQEQRLNYSLETLQDRESKVMAADGEIRDAEMEKEMVNFMQAQMMANLTMSMLSQANINPSSAFSLLGDTMMAGGGGFGF